MKLRRIRWYIWGFCFLLVLYTGVSVYFMEHFFLGTTINGRKAELLTVSEVNSRLLEEAAQFRLVLKGRDGMQEEMTAEELGVRYGEPDETARVKRRQNGFLWPRMFWQQDSYTIAPEAVVDEEKLEKAVEALACVQQGEEPKDAWVEMTESGYEVHPEEQGAKVQQEVLKEQLRASAGSLLPVLDLEEAGCYVKPELTVESQEIQNMTEALDHWLQAEITYAFGPRTEVVDEKTISSWIAIENGEARLMQEAVTAYVKDLAARYDTYKNPRQFNSTLRGPITVKGGNFGWQIDQESESLALYEAVSAGEQQTKEPAYLRTGRAWSENSDIGTTYIEIDLTAQHMWLYKEGQLIIDTDVVTGNMSRNYDTPAMVASVKYKQRNAVLRGANYASPVKYWMPFYGNYGIHDASWRSQFGGDIYLTNGSHGCVNTPSAAMKVIFENAEKGTPVVLYY